MSMFFCCSSDKVKKISKSDAEFRRSIDESNQLEQKYISPQDAYKVLYLKYCELYAKSISEESRKEFNIYLQELSKELSPEDAMTVKLITPKVG